MSNADKIVSLEAALGFFWEPGWQRWVLERSAALAVFFNWVYTSGFWPIMGTTSLLFCVHCFMALLGSENLCFTNHFYNRAFSTNNL